MYGARNRRAIRFATIAVGAGVLALAACQPPKSQPTAISEVFNCVAGATQESQNYVVPPGVTYVEMYVTGGQGGAGLDSAGDEVGGAGGGGGAVYGGFAVTPGETLTVNVGCAGAPNSVNGGKGGAPDGLRGDGRGGGVGPVNGAGETPAGAGGGASDVRRAGTVLAAAGGGGGGSGGDLDGDGAAGGGGGGAEGLPGGDGTSPCTGGGGGTQTGSGAMSTGCDENSPLLDLPEGGSGGEPNGGGGGGGYPYGGSGGGGMPMGDIGSGGGGGASYLHPSLVVSAATFPGIQPGDGYVVISYFV